MRTNKFRRNYSQPIFMANKKQLSRLKHRQVVAGHLSPGDELEYRELMCYFRTFYRDFIALEALIVAIEDIPQLTIQITYWEFSGGWTSGKYTLLTLVVTLISMGSKIIVTPCANENDCLAPPVPDELEDVPDETNQILRVRNVNDEDGGQQIELEEARDEEKDDSDEEEAGN